MGKARDWGFVDDFSYLEKGRTGAFDEGFALPPAGHPKRCHGALRGSNPPKQCTRWAIKGYRYCLSHAPRLYRVNKRGGTSWRKKALKGYYSRRASSTLKERLEELAVVEPNRRLSLLEEVDLARVGCERAVQLFEAACLGPDSDKASLETKAAALGVMRASLEHVGKMVADAARARKDSLETVDVEQLDYIVSQILVILEEEIVQEHGRAAFDRCAARFKQIRLPERKGAGGPDRAAIAAMLRGAAGAIETSVTAGGESP